MGLFPTPMGLFPFLPVSYVMYQHVSAGGGLTVMWFTRLVADGLYGFMD
jgi:hypothetical protein